MGKVLNSINYDLSNNVIWFKYKISKAKTCCLTYYSQTSVIGIHNSCTDIIKTFKIKEVNLNLYIS